MMAIKAALASSNPDFRFEYVFNCEKDAQKRQWIMKLHKSIENEPALGDAVVGDDAVESKAALGDAGPCLFCDIQDLHRGANGSKLPCATHYVLDGKKQINGHCEVRPFDILFCSTSCKDFSKMNPNKSLGCKSTENITALGAAETPGGSAQTIRGLCQLLRAYRPDLLMYENTIDIAEEKEGGGSDLQDLLVDWGEAGYEAKVIHADSFYFDVPQRRKRCWVVAINTENPRTISFDRRTA